MQASILPLGQQEAISDCAFDFYGLRLASCGLDAKYAYLALITARTTIPIFYSYSARIRLFRLNESNGEWASESEWKAHEAPVARVSWAHPEHGALIASCSFDRTIKVWQEAERASGSLQSPRWVERAVLTEAKGSVRDVAFAPAHFGLKLVSSTLVIALLPAHTMHFPKT
jgi:nucleoporin SEH1